MTRKGFTLIEVLAVIVILGVLFSITIPIVKNVMDSSKDKLYDTAVEEIKKAAKMYTVRFSEEIEGLENNGYGYITIGDLSDHGILETTVTNPKTGEAFNPTSRIEVTKMANGTYQFEFLGDQ